MEDASTWKTLQAQETNVLYEIRDMIRFAFWKNIILIGPRIGRGEEQRLEKH